MLTVLWRMSKGYRLRPWQSPYLRWRMETYAGLHAEQITSQVFWRFLRDNRSELLRYLRWAGRMNRMSKPA
jgi:hypothetical protein